MRRGKINAAGELSSKIGQLIIKYRQSELSNVKYTDTRKLWNKVRPTLGANSRAVTLGDKYGPQFDDLDAVNTHFASIATDPQYNIEEINSIIESIPQNRFINPVSEYEIFKLLSSLKKTASGSDGIPYWVFKYCAVQLTPVITKLINNTLNSGRPPTAWKSALVTPIQKTSSVKSFSDLRPISVTPILSRLVEKLVVRKYIIPALPPELISDQFAYRPTGSTTAALVSLTHIVAQRLESCNYVRCLLIDYSKAFDTIHHPTLFRKFLDLPIPFQIQRWIFRFFTGRRQAVVSGGKRSEWLPISRSILQGSGIGPSAYVLYSSDLKALSPYNSIIKYADDTSLLVPQHSSVSLEEEFTHLQNWSTANKLQINFDKTKEIVFRRPSTRFLITPHPLPQIEQVKVTKLLGIYISETFSTTIHVNHILSVANQRIFLLGQLKYQGLSRDALHVIFTAIVLSLVNYALPSFAGQLSKGDQSRLDSLFRRAYRRGLCHEILTMDDLILKADTKLFHQITYPTHCLHPLLPPERYNKKSLRTRGHDYSLQHIHTNLFKNSFVNRSLFSFI